METGHGGGVDQVCASRIGAQQRQEGLDAVDHPPQIDAQQPGPVRQRHVGDRGRGGNAGVVAEQIDASVAAPNLVRQRLHAVIGGHIGADADRADLLSRPIECGLLDVRDDDLHAFANETFGDGAADTRGAAGDDRDLAREMLHA
jgi:hypothetical protein